MKYFAVWIDRTHAKIFQCSRDKIDQKMLSFNSQRPGPLHLDNEDLAHREKTLFPAVVEALSTGSQILIMGPGVMKHHFQNYLNEHYPLLSKRVVGCETADYPTDPQISAQILRYFKLA